MGDDLQHVFGSCRHLRHLRVRYFSVEDKGVYVRDPLTRLVQALPPTITHFDLCNDFDVQYLVTALSLLPKLVSLHLFNQSAFDSEIEARTLSDFSAPLEHLTVGNTYESAAILAWYQAFRRPSFLPHLRTLP